MLFVPRPTYASDAVADADDAWVATHLLVSHASMLLASVYALHRGLTRLGAYGTTATLVSVCYHLCRNGLLCLAALPLDELRKADHTTALTFFGALGLHLLAITARGVSASAYRLEEAAGYVLPLVAMLAVRAHPFSIQSMVVVGAFIVTVAAYRFLSGSHGFQPPPRGLYRIGLLALGFLLGAAAAVFFFVEDEAPRNDSVRDGHMHALWHWLSGFAIWALAAGVGPTSMSPC
jgi:hypothetical protein